MSTKYSLRPVPPTTHSPLESTASSGSSRTPPAEDRFYPFPPQPLPPGAPAPPRPSRRSFSPSALRELDLSQSPDTGPRRYPPPPTGHELMAMFPAAAPEIFSEIRQGPNQGFSTSDFFRSQERAFFAKSGKEVIRLNLDVRTLDAVDNEGAVRAKKRPRASSSSSHSFSRPYPNPHSSATPLVPPHPSNHMLVDQTNAPASASTAPIHPMNARPMPPPPVPSSEPVSHHHSHPHPHHPPPSSHHGPPPPPPSHHGPRRSPDHHHHHHPHHPVPHPGHGMVKPERAHDEFAEDESWKRPMPHHERRRAGKHTKRVVKT